MNIHGFPAATTAIDKLIVVFVPQHLVANLLMYDVGCRVLVRLFEISLLIYVLYEITHLTHFDTLDCFLLDAQSEGKHLSCHIDKYIDKRLLSERHNLKGRPINPNTKLNYLLNFWLIVNYLHFEDFESFVLARATQQVNALLFLEICQYLLFYFDLLGISQYKPVYLIMISFLRYVHFISTVACFLIHLYNQIHIFVIFRICQHPRIFYLVILFFQLRLKQWLPIRRGFKMIVTFRLYDRNKLIAVENNLGFELEQPQLLFLDSLGNCSFKNSIG